MLLLVRSSLLAIFFVVPVLGSLYEYEDGTSPFGWLHAIMLGKRAKVSGFRRKHAKSHGASKHAKFPRPASPYYPPMVLLL